MDRIQSKINDLQSIYPNAKITYSKAKKSIFIIHPARVVKKETQDDTGNPCCICLDNQPTHYFNCRCVRKEPIVCIKCLNNKQFVQSSKCPNCRSWFSKTATSPFSPDQIYHGKTRPKKELTPAEQTRLNKSLVRVLTKTRSGHRMKELIEQGADIHYENGNAVLYAAFNGHYQIFDFLVNYLDYKTIFSLEFHNKILDSAFQSLGSNQPILRELLLSVNTESW